MELVITCLEIIGVIAFALSGNIIALKKNMDLLGVCVLGLTTAVGGGIVRDLLLGLTPPMAFRDPTNFLLSVAVSIIAFIPVIRRPIMTNGRLHDLLLLWTDSIGLAIFTVCGARSAIYAGFASNSFLVVFVAVVTGVGGGVMRDVFAGDRPYIFVKHIYACAALVGAIVCRVLWFYLGEATSMTIGFVIVLLIRLLAAHYRWSLPKAGAIESETTKN